MRCKCKHSETCKFKDQLHHAFKNIVEILCSGGRNPKFEKVDELVQSICRYRHPTTKEEDAKQCEKTNVRDMYF